MKIEKYYETKQKSYRLEKELTFAYCTFNSIRRHPYTASAKIQFFSNPPPPLSAFVVIKRPLKISDVESQVESPKCFCQIFFFPIQFVDKEKNCSCISIWFIFYSILYYCQQSIFFINFLTQLRMNTVFEMLYFLIVYVKALKQNKKYVFNNDIICIS